jgi:uncharacterized protein
MKVVHEHPLPSFFAAAYAISWVFWLPAVAASVGWIPSVPSALLHFAGGLGPLSSAILVTRMTGDRAVLTRLRRRLFQGGSWVGTAILIPAVLFVLSTLVVIGIYREPIAWQFVGASAELSTLPRPLYWLANVICYGYGEEVGWRGFALPRLQARMPALRASLVLTVGWAGWHLPLFAFSEGLSNLGLAGAAGWLLSLALGSILLTWLFNSSRGSIAAVASFHAALDIFITSPVSPYVPNVMGALLTIGAVGLVPVVGSEHLARRPRVIEPVPHV